MPRSKRGRARTMAANKRRRRVYLDADPFALADESGVQLTDDEGNVLVADLEPAMMVKNPNN